MSIDLDAIEKRANCPSRAAPAGVDSDYHDGMEHMASELLEELQ